jgi:hypothetical protein
MGVMGVMLLVVMVMVVAVVVVVVVVVVPPGEWDLLSCDTRQPIPVQIRNLLSCHTLQPIPVHILQMQALQLQTLLAIACHYRFVVRFVDIV